MFLAQPLAVRRELLEAGAIIDFASKRRKGKNRKLQQQHL